MAYRIKYLYNGEYCSSGMYKDRWTAEIALPSYLRLYEDAYIVQTDEEY